MTDARRRISETLKSIAGDEFIRIYQTWPREKKDATYSDLWTAIQDLIAHKYGISNPDARRALGDGIMWLLIPFGTHGDVQDSLEGIVRPGSAEAVASDVMRYLIERTAEIAYAPFSEEEQDRISALDSLPHDEAAATAEIELDKIDQKLSTVRIVLHVLDLKQHGRTGADDED